MIWKNTTAVEALRPKLKNILLLRIVMVKHDILNGL
jgi:hypothetical protein